MKNFKFTIFTSCYNSEPFIQNLLDSIDKQTYRNFEWIVYDDKSVDKTVDIVNQYIQDKDFEITWIVNKENKGVKLNRKDAILRAKGDFFVTWDHDDIQLPHQLETFNTLWNKYPGEHVANIFGSIQNEKSKRLGKIFEQDDFESNYLKEYAQYFFNGQERMVCIKTNILRKYNDPHPIFGEFYDGDLMWGKIATQYQSVFTNTIVRTYYTGVANSLSKGGRMKVPMRVFHYKAIWINELLPYMPGNIKMKLRYFFAYCFYGIISKAGLYKIFNSAHSLSNKLMVLLFLPITFIVFLLLKATNKID